MASAAFQLLIECVIMRFAEREKNILLRFICLENNDYRERLERSLLKGWDQGGGGGGTNEPY